MSWWHKLQYLVSRLDRTRAERDLEEEIATHLEIETEERMERGASDTDARYAARRSFGNVTSAREESRRYWAFSWLGAGIQDLRYAVRTLGRDRALAAVVVVSIAFAIGANSAVFSIVDAIFFRPLPGVVRPEGITSFYGDDRTTPQPDWASIAYPEFSLLRDVGSSFRDVAAYCRLPFNLTTEAETTRVIGELVSEDYFELLGARPVMGRAFQREDHAPGAPLTAVVSARFWKRLGEDRKLVGRDVEINGRSTRVVGVAEEGFGGLLLDWYGRADIWLPLAAHEDVFGRDMSSSNSPWLMVAGRLGDGVSIDQARADVDRIAREIERLDPVANKDRAITVVPSTEARFWPGHKDSVTQLLAALVGVGAFVLLVACMNVAGLLLARATTRRHEIAVRLALGASTGRVVRQLLTELGPLIVMSASLGLVLAGGILQGLTAFEHPFRITLDLQTQLDLRVVAFTLAISLGVITLAGVLPALRVAHSPLASGIRDVTSMWRSGARGLGVRKLLLVGQVSIAVLVLVGAGLFLQSLWFLYSVDPGFATKNVVMAEVRTGVYMGSDERVETFYRDLVQQTQSLPGVSSVALAQEMLLSRGGRQVTVEIPAAQDGQAAKEPRVRATRVSPSYFKTLDITAQRGEIPDEGVSEDLAGAVINEALAKRLWEEEDPVGRYLKVRGVDLRVLSVVEDIRHGNLFEQPRPHIYLPYSEKKMAAFLLIRHAGDPSEILRLLKQEVRKLDGSVALSGLKTMEQHIDIGLSGPRLLTAFTTFLGVGVLLLTAVGIFSLASFIVNQGQREIGVRKALGEEPRSIAKRILVQGLRYCVLGLVIGMGAAAGLSRFIESQLHGIDPTGPAVFAGAGIILVATAMFACYLPARRAAKVDPIRTLRHD